MTKANSKFLNHDDQVDEHTNAGENAAKRTDSTQIIYLANQMHVFDFPSVVLKQL